jgi:hypothetical protein
MYRFKREECIAFLEEHAGAAEELRCGCGCGGSVWIARTPRALCIVTEFSTKPVLRLLGLETQVEFDLYRDRAQSHLPVAGNEGFYQKLDAAWARGLS